jgi:hypothetical protein
MQYYGIKVGLGGEGGNVGSFMFFQLIVKASWREGMDWETEIRGYNRLSIIYRLLGRGFHEERR